MASNQGQKPIGGGTPAPAKNGGKKGGGDREAQLREEAVRASGLTKEELAAQDREREEARGNGGEVSGSVDYEGPGQIEPKRIPNDTGEREAEMRATKDRTWTTESRDRWDDSNPSFTDQFKSMRKAEEKNAEDERKRA